MKFLLGLLVPLSLLFIWIVYGFWHEQSLLPPPQKVLQVAWEAWQQGEIQEGLRWTLHRMFLGLLIGGSAGYACGALLAFLPKLDGFIAPTLHALRQIALFAWIPLLSFFFGMGESARQVFIALTAFFTLILPSYLAFKQSDPRLFEVAQLFGFSRWQVFRLLRLPQAAPLLLTGLQLALVYSWLAAIASEYFFSTGPGLGHLIIDGREQFNVSLVLTGVFLSGAIGGGLSLITSLIGRRFLRNPG